MQENYDLDKYKEEGDIERKNLRSELREYKLRETRMITDYSELEEENIGLQKQVSILKSSQVKYSNIFANAIIIIIINLKYIFVFRLNLKELNMRFDDYMKIWMCSINK